MDIDRLRYFTVIAHTGSLTGAAEILHLSVPALSKAMSVLESELGIKLFQPSGRGIALTEEGKSALPRAERAIQAVESVRLGDEAPTGAPRLRIGTFEVFSTYFLGPLMRESFPEHELELHELIPGALEPSLVEKRLDFGITYLPIPLAGLDFLKIGNIGMGVYGRPRFKGEDLSSLPFAVPILPIQGTPTKVNGLDGWPDNRLPRYPKYRVTLMESAMELCRQGLAVGYLPHFIVALHNRRVIESFRLVEIPVSGVPRLRQDVFLVKRWEAKEDATVKKLSRAIRLGIGHS